MKIPFHRPLITQDDIDLVVHSLKNGWLTMGEKTIEFERRFREYLAVRNAVAVNSCTAALHLACKAIDLSKGDEVIVPPFTFVSPAEVLLYFGAVPVFVDIERDTHLIDAGKIEERITDRTRAIIPVHYAGQPADMERIMALADEFNLAVIEDAAHALPAWYHGRRIGTLGDITCFSFYATKTLTTGEGGMITTENDAWAEMMQSCRLHGISRDAWKRYSDEGSWEYDVLDAGFKYNTTDINAALGLEQLRRVEAMWQDRVKIAERYNNAFQERAELIPYQIRDDRVSAWHLYPLKLDLEALRLNRNQFIEELKKRGIGTSVHFIPLYRFSFYRNMGSADEFPESDWVFERVVSLPIFPGMNEREIDYVVENVIDVVDSFRR